ncbi:amidohydrolase family-domain-containing protein [Lentinula raphanica]|uniref:Amidohydrolase family-domain-containing protein n=1 Tax=Lentinula raphanica TaxID=153919 RepID=A0AA38P4N7_9AGAR|nr:amidohydrolase family-domain-containing protein [Lentinula raphanica]KAJ3968481.1 amidohydrolase family-domain-containing protein [Lentinula raphanica]
MSKRRSQAGVAPTHDFKQSNEGAFSFFRKPSFQSLVVALSISVFFLLKDSLRWQSNSTYVLCSPEGTEKVYTVDSTNSRVQCILIKGAVIDHTGSLDQVLQQWQNSLVGFQLIFSKYYAPSVHYIQPGAIVVPGLADSHAHILEYGATLQLPLEGTKSINETVKRVREYILSNDDIQSDKTKFVFGGGWDHTVWPNGAWPTAADLESDPIIRGRPVILQSKDCHALWLSQRALESSLPFPEEVDGGLIVRDFSGRPTGMLLDNAQDLVKQPQLHEDELLRRFNSAIQKAVEYGLTSIHDAGLDPASLSFFRKESRRRTLPIRIYGMSYFNENGEYWGNITTPLIGGADGRLTARSVKIFADGALRTGGAALYEPYADNPSTNGLMRLDQEVLFKYIPLFLRDGWQVNVHAIGDRANGLVVDAFQASLKGANVTALRPRLEHAQLMTKADMRRLGELGVIASIQPTHAISDMLFAEDRLGPERVKNLYAFRTLIESGARITLGSDAPVEDLNPLAGFYAAVTRLSRDGESPHGPDGWFPEQRLTREEALRGMTIDPAYASFTESFMGSLEVGKRADFVVFSQDIMSIKAKEILTTKVLATAVDGKLVFGEL